MMERIINKMAKNWCRITFIGLGTILIYEAIAMDWLGSIPVRIGMGIAGILAIGFGIVYSGETLTDEYNEEN